ncbi:phage major capsid protein [Loktanella sp. R86503]|uniref:phage major capsid protein n=1 Tax=Loktanella sp. R86503 TaxID=3093847 RepID=UPI0036DA5F2D
MTNHTHDIDVAEATKELLNAAKSIGGIEQRLSNMEGHIAKADEEGEKMFDEVKSLKIAANQRAFGGEPMQSWGREFIGKKTSELSDLSRSNGGKVQMDVKANLTTSASSGGAIDVPMRDATVGLPKRRMMVRSLLQVIQTESGTVEYADQTTRNNNPSTVAEGGVKPESNYEWELKNIPTRVIAHWVKASVQILSDAPQIQGLIDSELRYGLVLAEEAQLLFGDGTGANLTGLVPNAAAFADPLAASDPDMIDMIGSAILQVGLADHAPDGIIIHPSDWWRMRMLKDADGRYILGNPQSDVVPSLFGLPVIPTKAMPVDKFLVGSFSEAATLYDRWQPRVEVGYVNDDFTRNLVTIRAEERIALAVKKSDALAYGDFGNVA